MNGQQPSASGLATPFDAFELKPMSSRVNPSGAKSRNVIFAGFYKFRSADGILSAGVPLVLGTFFCCFGVYELGTVSDAVSSVVRVGFIGGGFVFLCLGAITAIAVLSSKEKRVKITEEGIIIGVTFHSWAAIDGFQGVQNASGVYFRYSARGAMWGDGSIALTPKITKAEYVAVAKELKERVQPHFPELYIATEVVADEP